MDVAKKNFPDGFPTLKELRKLNEGKDVPPETAWIWGEDDEVRSLWLLSAHASNSHDPEDRTSEPPHALTYKIRERKRITRWCCSFPKVKPPLRLFLLSLLGPSVYVMRSEADCKI